MVSVSQARSESARWTSTVRRFRSAVEQALYTEANVCRRLPGSCCDTAEIPTVSQAKERLSVWGEVSVVKGSVEGMLPGASSLASLSCFPSVVSRGRGGVYILATLSTVLNPATSASSASLLDMRDLGPSSESG